jgi:membrane-associated phospholipid phosphatase
VRHSEWIAAAYFVYLAVAAWFRHVPMRRRVVLLAAAAAVLAAIGAARDGLLSPVRDWMPLLYILGGYYASVALFIAPSTVLEAWLIGWDRRLLGDPATRFAPWPRAFLAYLDLVYMLCFLLVPGGCVVLLAADRPDLIDRYWTIVAGAELGSFAPLAFIQTRPPWVIERKAVLADRAVHRLTSQMVRHLTICVNTFPSGHAAGSLAVALAVIGPVPIAGTTLLVLAASIAIACIVGRYHYIVDVVAGVALAVVIFFFARNW